MRWFKHMTCSYDDTKLSAMMDELGMEGYGFWWRILEVIAEQMDETGNCFCTFSAKKWGNFFGFSAKKFRNFVGIFQKLKILEVEFSENSITVVANNLLKYKDEWSRKKARNSGVTPEKLRSKEVEEEVEEDNKNIHTLTTFECVSESELPDPAPPKSEEEKNPVVDLTDDDAAGQGKQPACPQKTIVDAFHEILPEFPRVRTWRANSATALRTRWREKWKEGKFADASGGVGYFRRFFAYVRKSDWLMGRKTGKDGRSFVCTLAWMLQARHFDDIVAGRYHDRDREAA